MATAQIQAPLISQAPSQTKVPAALPSTSVEINIFAAASLTDAFGEIGKLFEIRHPGTTVLFNFGGTQQLAQQIIEGAPADVFASANLNQMDVVIDAGEIVTGTQKEFAQNRLVVIFPKDNPAGLVELRNLGKPEIKLVFAAKEVPVGQYTLDFLDKASTDHVLGANFKDQVLKNVVSFEDNVKAVLAKVALGEADGGIVYSSDVYGDAGGKVGWLEIPVELNVIASYPIAPITASKSSDLATAFIDLVLSPEGQKILARYNFIPVNSP
jgi:molybdate transport system substrate-binding protein